MAIALGNTAQASGTTSLLTPSWSGAPYVGALLLMEVTTSRTSAVTYFGNGNAEPAGWTRFGDNQQSNYPNKSVAQFWHIADGVNDTPHIGGYSDSGRTTLAGTTYATIIELRDGIVGSTCFGTWDVANAKGLGYAVGNTAPWETFNTTGTTTTLTISAASWSEAYSSAALWVLAQSPTATWTSLSSCDSTYGPFGTGGQFQGVKALASGGALSPVITISGATGRSMAAYVVGFSPASIITKTISARATITGQATATQPARATITGTATKGISATAQIMAAVATSTKTITATASIAIHPTPGISATAAIKATRTGTIPATAQIAFTPLIILGSGNSIKQALGSAYVELAGDLDGGGAADTYTTILDGGQALS